MRPFKLVWILAVSALLALSAASPDPAGAAVPNRCRPNLVLHDLGTAFQVQATLTCRTPAFDINLVAGTVSAGPELNDRVGVDCANARVCTYWSPVFDKSWGVPRITASTLWLWRDQLRSPIHRVRLAHDWAVALSSPPDEDSH
ncbi:MAG: hypothetical protein ACJ76S_05145 [Solirubrobacteraceae bacterium]